MTKNLATESVPASALTKRSRSHDNVAATWGHHRLPECIARHFWMLVKITPHVTAEN